ncbi:NmrA family transcriptional regulator [Parapedobacter pyrenivorans]|uniref:NmrA family transcriptional regulator n=2 Tax=Parapedobacter pyrenivorans TaxID=1305674 RepID=A0A917HXR8_9SPHI|nr:NmrA family transcriptional regulator [Parapedobacter pyrenivorans]
MTIQHPNLILKKGTMLDRTTIEEAIQGSDVVIETVGCVSEGTKLIIQAMKKFNVKRLIVVSTSNARDGKDLPDKKFTLLLGMTRGALKLLGLFHRQYRNAVYELRKIAGMVRNSDLDWTLVRVAGLTNKAKSNDVKSGYLGQGIISFSTSRADMADFLLQQVTDKTYIRQAPAISS